MTDMKTNIQSLFDGSDAVKDGQMPKDELTKVCTHLGMTEEEVTVMFDDIGLKDDFVTITSFMDWVFGSEEAAAPAKAEEEEEEEEDDVEDELDEEPPPKTNTGARASVSAEAYGAWNVKKAFEAPVYPKTDEQKGRIKGVLSGSFMFQAVDPKDFEALLGAVQEKMVVSGDRVINQGDDGDFMCIIETGKFDCLVKSGEEELCVKTCASGDVFGELALMYNAPRAASVVAKEEGMCWVLDRETFNNIVRDAAQKKREKYESFLKQVPLLKKMDDYQRSQISDALKEEQVAADTVIVKEGEEGNKFYIVAEGNATAVKEGSEEVMQYEAGSYFGELALLNDAPRAATVTSKGCKVLTLDRKSFNRLLPSELLKEGAAAYK